MLRLRLLIPAGLLALLVLATGPAAMAAEDRHVGLHDMTCDGISAMGDGLPASTKLDLSLTDPANGKVLRTAAVTTSASGSFEHRLETPMNRILAVKLLVSRPDGTRIGFAEHVMAMGSPMCTLPFTGGARTGAMLVAGLALLTAGGLVLTASRRPGRAATATGPGQGDGHEPKTVGPKTVGPKTVGPKTVGGGPAPRPGRREREWPR
jgi:hypothetical protein